MGLIEQAILFVGRRSGDRECQILNITSGIHQSDIVEIQEWGADFLYDPAQKPTPETPHLYFHPLPSGSFVLGRVIFDSREAGTSCHNACMHDACMSYHIHCLVIPPETLSRFHNNVILLYHEILRTEGFYLFHPDEGRTDLRPLVAEGAAPVLEPELFEALCDFPGPVGMATLVRSCIDSVCTFFTEGPPTLKLLSGLLQCFPVSLRPEISFATALHFSPSRPLRIMCVESQSATTRSICGKYVIPFFNFMRLTPQSFEKIGGNKYWAQLIYEILQARQFEFLRDRFVTAESMEFGASHDGPISDWKQLQQYGKTLLEELQISMAIEKDSLKSSFTTGTPTGGTPPSSAHGPIMQIGEETFRSDVVHHVFARKEETENDPGSRPPLSSPLSSAGLLKAFPNWAPELRKMDSLLARALFGDSVALETLEKQWKKLSPRLTPSERGRISESYVHLIQSVLTQPQDPDYPKHPRRSIDALELLNLFIADYGTEE